MSEWVGGCSYDAREHVILGQLCGGRGGFQVSFVAIV